ncbi:Dpy-30-domain-containing protein [Terfezia boudieri ATCC MYA-4762]|uniref:Dpy-30-domain-containing protein n=1 Tax=Terfezia boudieri ATCC MYA-4762 TaxID=1051890 RepID=A0A3N4LAG8_9PEZI|nr:Dpy-30-domain-containing protein [Terfezia boudieri ATCC MYA-4762]
MPSTPLSIFPLAPRLFLTIWLWFEEHCKLCGEVSARVARHVVLPEGEYLSNVELQGSYTCNAHRLSNLRRNTKTHSSMNNQQHQHHGPSPPQGQMPQGQHQGGAYPLSAQGQSNASQYGLQQNQTSPPLQHYQSSQQAYQGHPQYNQYQSSYQQLPSQQHQQQGQTPYRSQPLPNHQAPQPVPQQQPTAQPSSTTQTSSVGNLPRSNTPGHATTPTYSSSNQIAPGGAPARQYINETVAPYLLEGMKMLVREQPPDPLRVLGEWLIEQHSKMHGSEVL